MHINEWKYEFEGESVKDNVIGIWFWGGSLITIDNKAGGQKSQKIDNVSLKGQPLRSGLFLQAMAMRASNHALHQNMHCIKMCIDARSGHAVAMQNA